MNTGILANKLSRTLVSSRGHLMVTLDPVDKVEIQVLVDNLTDNLSSVPAFVETEVAGLTRRRRGKWVLAGRCLCCAAHGLSCLITTHRGAKKRTILFDTGPEDRTFEQNVSRLDADLAPTSTRARRRHSLSKRRYLPLQICGSRAPLPKSRGNLQLAAGRTEQRPHRVYTEVDDDGIVLSV